MLNILRGADCKDLAWDYVHAADLTDLPPDLHVNIARIRAELLEAGLEAYGQEEWDHWIAVAERDQAIQAQG